jgi:hypothetical protein
MRSKGAKIPEQWESLEDADISELTNTLDGRPLQQGLKPVFDLEDAANLTPVGDVLSAKEAYDAVK